MKSRQKTASLSAVEHTDGTCSLFLKTVCFDVFYLQVYTLICQYPRTASSTALAKIRSIRYRRCNISMTFICNAHVHETTDKTLLIQYE